MQETALKSNLSGSGLLRSEFFFNCFNLFCCAVGLRFSLFCSILFGIPNTTGFEVSRSRNCFLACRCLLILFHEIDFHVFNTRDRGDFYIADGLILTK